MVKKGDDSLNFFSRLKEALIYPFKELYLMMGLVGFLLAIFFFLPTLTGNSISSLSNGDANLMGVILFFIFVATILLVQGTRRIPVQYAKRIVGNKQYGGVRQYIPLKVNAAGVMPIIFAQALMIFPVMLSRFDATQGIAAAFYFGGFWYTFTSAILIILFTYFYTAITINPTQMAEDMKRNGGFIPGVKPGKQTSEFIDNIVTRVTLPGSIFLALVAIMPAFAQLAGVSVGFSQFYGGTSLLIMVGVILDTLQQIESHLLMRHYDGFMKSGKMKGRR